MKKRYILYLITNNINNKIYIGQHTTTNIEDGYFGSGKLIIKAIKKYGIENFTFKLLYEVQNSKELNLLEKSVVTEEFCNREDTYNIRVGGDNSPIAMSTRKLLAIKKLGVKQSKEHNANISKSLTGMIWINNGIISRFVKSDNIPVGWSKGRIVTQKMIAHNKCAAKGKIRKGTKHTVAHNKIVLKTQKYFTAFINNELSLDKVRKIYPELMTYSDKRLLQNFRRYIPNFSIRQLRKAYDFA